MFWLLCPITATLFHKVYHVELMGGVVVPYALNLGSRVVAEGFLQEVVDERRYIFLIKEIDISSFSHPHTRITSGQIITLDVQ